MTSVAVVILNYNGEKLLPKFLPSVISYSTGARVIVVDNASNDSSVSIITNQFSQVELITLDRNYGFCGGYNRAIAQIDSEYIVLLNSDIEVTEGWLSPMINLLDSDPKIKVVQPKILSYRDKTLFEYAGAGGGLIDLLGYPFCRGRIFDFVEKDVGQYNDQRRIFWASGACMMIRKESFEQFGGLDEYFFAHMEEIDLCWKITRADGLVYYTGKSTVYHVGAGTLGYESPFKVFLNFRNGIILIYKHFSAGEMFWKLPLRLALDWVAAFLFLFKGQMKAAASVLKAHYAFFKDLSIHRKKRREIHKVYPQYPKDVVYQGSVVFDFYLRKRRKITA